MEDISKIWPEWTVDELIGRGTFGQVYKVKRTAFEYTSYAAVKVIEFPQDPSEVRELVNTGMDSASIQEYFKDLAKNLVAEIRIMESLKTANNIVAIEDYALRQHENKVGWTIYIRMELLESLSHGLEREGELPVPEVVKLGIDICQALTSCEKVHIIHRDIEPDNIFRNSFGDYKLGDFGISRQMESTRSMHSQKGTSMYMAPEVYSGQSYDHTVDIYSLGIMLYKLLNHGRFPFMPAAPAPVRPGDAQAAMEKRLSGNALPIPARADLELWQILHRACASDAKKRYSSAEELRKELTVYLNRMGSNSKPKEEEKQLITNTDFPEQESTWEETSKTLSMWGNAGEQPLIDEAKSNWQKPEETVAQKTINNEVKPDSTESDLEERTVNAFQQNFQNEPEEYDEEKAAADVEYDPHGDTDTDFDWEREKKILKRKRAAGGFRIVASVIIFLGISGLLILLFAMNSSRETSDSAGSSTSTESQSLKSMDEKQTEEIELIDVASIDITKTEKLHMMR